MPKGLCLPNVYRHKQLLYIFECVSIQCNVFSLHVPLSPCVCVYVLMKVLSFEEV